MQVFSLCRQKSVIGIKGDIYIIYDNTKKIKNFVIFRH